MLKTLILVASSLLLIFATSPIQSNVPAVPVRSNDGGCVTQKGLPPDCVPGRHPVVHCVCDGPAGPCNWVWKCEKDPPNQSFSGTNPQPSSKSNFRLRSTKRIF